MSCKDFDEAERASEEWETKLLKLNDHINALTVWNGYAEDCQREYDDLLQQDPMWKLL